MLINPARSGRRLCRVLGFCTRFDLLNAYPLRTPIAALLRLEVVRQGCSRSFPALSRRRSQSTKPAGDIIFGLFLTGIREQFLGAIHLNQMAEIKESGEIRAPGRLLHVVRHDHNGKLIF